MSQPERITYEKLRKFGGIKSGEVSPAERQRLATEGKARLGLFFNRTVTAFPDEITTDLQISRAILKDTYTATPTAAAVTADYLLHKWVESAGFLAMHYEGDDRPRFSLYYDMATGMEMVGLAVGLADRARAANHQIPNRFSSETLRTLKTQVQYAKEILDQDEGRGLILADAVAQVLKGERTEPINFIVDPHLIREFVIAGAEVGAEIYKEVYPLAEQVLEQK